MTSAPIASALSTAVWIPPRAATWAPITMGSILARLGSGSGRDQQLHRQSDPHRRHPVAEGDRRDAPAGHGSERNPPHGACREHEGVQPVNGPEDGEADGGDGVYGGGADHLGRIEP